jgi:hypothetical protein
MILSMIRTGRRGAVFVILAVSSFAQSGGQPDKSQSSSSALDVRQIVELSIAATQRHWHEWLGYTYFRRDRNRRLDNAGQVKSEEVVVSRTILMNGAQFRQILERDGRPLPLAEDRKQNQALEQLKRETPNQRTERLRKEEEENMSLLGEVPRAFDFQWVGEEVLNGRPVWILQAAPHPGYRARGKFGKMFSKVSGRLWVDKQDFAWIKVDAEVIQPFSMGLFLARVLPGSRIAVEQTRVAQGIWMPENIEVRAAAKIFFLKSLQLERILTYSGYLPPQAGAPKGDPAIPGK